MFVLLYKMAIIEKIQRTFWINPTDWANFQKQSIDLQTSSSERIEKFIQSEVNYRNKKHKSKKNAK